MFCTNIHITTISSSHIFLVQSLGSIFYCGSFFLVLYIAHSAFVYIPYPWCYTQYVCVSMTICCNEPTCLAGGCRHNDLTVLGYFSFLVVVNIIIIMIYITVVAMTEYLSIIVIIEVISLRMGPQFHGKEADKVVRLN